MREILLILYKVNYNKSGDLKNMLITSFECHIYGYAGETNMAVNICAQLSTCLCEL